MPAPSRLGISNQALDLIKGKRIQSIGENSLEARTCATHYPQVLSLALEGPVGSDHVFSFANRRVVLAETTNEREFEWVYAYAVPDDMGSAIRLIPNLESFGVGIPVPLAGEPYSEVWASAVSAIEADYIIENGVIYANVETATLEYGIKEIDEASLPASVVEAMTSDLASRLAVPIKNDRKLRRELMEEADLLWQRAIADDKNRQPQRSGGYLSETTAARAGLISGL
jgi:hypothetical protein